MATSGAFVCSRCGESHDGPPFSYGALAPAYWREALSGEPTSALGAEQCVIEGAHYFLRARIVLPVIDGVDDFEWGVWVSLSEANYTRANSLWENPGRVDEPPCFGWLATELTCYPSSTLNLKTMVHTQPPGVRPTLELEPTHHPLAVEQRTGITRARVLQFAEHLAHPDGPAT